MIDWWGIPYTIARRIYINAPHEIVLDWKRFCNLANNVAGFYGYFPKGKEN